MKYTYTFLLAIALVGCNTAQQVSKHTPKEEAKQEVVAQEKEPTEPHETEVYEPVPPTVKVNTNGVPRMPSYYLTEPT